MESLILVICKEAFVKFQKAVELLKESNTGRMSLYCLIVFVPALFNTNSGEKSKRDF